MPTFFQDAKGRVIGHVREETNRRVYSDAKGVPVAWVRKDSNGRETTFDGKGRPVGNGDQGLRLIK